MANDPVGYELLNKLMVNGPALAFKWFLVVALVMYSFFALVLIKQAGIMTETFESEINPTVKTFVWIHFLVSLFLVVVSIVVL